MLTKIKLWAIAIGAGICALFGIYFLGKRTGKKDQEVKQTKEVLNEVKKAKKVSASVINSDAATKLSNRYSRK